MLENLSIKHLAIINDCDLQFNDGFTVITGESGAGKSILIDAIELLSGHQANDEYIQHDQDVAFIEAIFHIPYNYQTNSIQELTDGDDTLIVSRKLRRGKPSQARINSQTVPIKKLKEIIPFCLQLTGQHDTYQLFSSQFQLDIYDDFCGQSLQKLKNNYQHEFSAYKKLKEQLTTLTEDSQSKSEKAELLDFQIQDINSQNFHSDEDEKLKAQLKKLQSFKDRKVLQDQLQQHLQTISSLTQDSVVSAQSLSSLDDQFEDPTKQLEQLSYEIESLQEVFQSSDDNYDQNISTESIENRLDTIFKYITKYHVNSVNDLLDQLNKLMTERSEIDTQKQSFAQLEMELDCSSTQLAKLAEQLHRVRQDRQHKFTTRIETEMKELNFLTQSVKVSIERNLEFNKNGCDSVHFLISTNPGMPPKALDKIASGGELSRIMLALKVTQSKTQSAPTLIFDEIDTGVGGVTAASMGLKLKDISNKQQLICISHLPQIASQSDHHLHIEKKAIKNATTVDIRYLNSHEKQDELSRMQGIHI